jgi:site-specific DNA-methyltransferase (adenine-specific)
LQGNEREVIATERSGSSSRAFQSEEQTTAGSYAIDKGTSPWEGWGTALKPALEPITVARKPLIGTVAENVLEYGTGGINIDGCRVGTEDSLNGGAYSNNREISTNEVYGEYKRIKDDYVQPTGRFPANLIHDGSDEVVSLFPNTKSAGMRQRKAVNTWGGVPQNYPKETSLPASEGSASRFFYCAKASKSERNKGCEELEGKGIGAKGNGLGRVCETCGISQLKPEFCKCEVKSWINPATSKNNHPTVKPIALMEYLVKLVSREGATVLDPFAGSGTTGIACRNLNRNFIGIELSEEYYEIACKRIGEV